MTRVGITAGPPFVKKPSHHDGVKKPSHHDGQDPRNQGEHAMGMINKLAASGIAAKVIQEARKPQNQAKMKKFVADLQNKNKGTRKHT